MSNDNLPNVPWVLGEYWPPDVIPTDQALLAMMDAQNNAIEACARLAQDWPGSPPNLAAAIRTLRRSETLLTSSSTCT